MFKIIKVVTVKPYININININIKLGVIKEAVISYPRGPIYILKNLIQHEDIGQFTMET